jgi:putative ubiquitin-RnfH superfamily antitoxin RatB of RatAB toxin-antitoxin module
MSSHGEAAQRKLSVEVAYATPDKQLLVELEVDAGCTVGEAIEQSGICDAFAELTVDSSAVGIFSRKVPLEQVLKEGDRVEIYRPLLADPRENRRRRAEQG